MNTNTTAQDLRDWAPSGALRHDYQPDPQSGAGNCVCGAQLAHRWHPHQFTAAADRVHVCVCGLAKNSTQHLGDR